MQKTLQNAVDKSLALYPTAQLSQSVGRTLRSETHCQVELEPLPLESLSAL